MPHPVGEKSEALNALGFAKRLRELESDDPRVVRNLELARVGATDPGPKALDMLKMEPKNEEEIKFWGVEFAQKQFKTFWACSSTLERLEERGG